MSGLRAVEKVSKKIGRISVTLAARDKFEFDALGKKFLTCTSTNWTLRILIVWLCATRKISPTEFLPKKFSHPRSSRKIFWIIPPSPPIILYLRKCKVSCFRHVVSSLCINLKSRSRRRNHSVGLWTLREKLRQRHQILRHNLSRQSSLYARRREKYFAEFRPIFEATDFESAIRLYRRHRYFFAGRYFALLVKVHDETSKRLLKCFAKSESADGLAFYSLRQTVSDYNSAKYRPCADKWWGFALSTYAGKKFTIPDSCDVRGAESSRCTYKLFFATAAWNFNNFRQARWFSDLGTAWICWKISEHSLHRAD